MGTILIIGNTDAFIKSLAKKLYIEKWRVYLLVNNKNFKKPTHVFEQYSFDYSSESIGEVINSCKADLILFTGVYDSSYNWEGISAKSTALKYVSDLTNILMEASTQGVSNFIYLSSQVVFEDDYLVDINEDMPVYPTSYKGMAISMGENMTTNRGEASQMETTVVRLANLYGIADNKEESKDTITNMCIEALVNSRIRIDAKRGFTSLYVDDAVEALYLLIDAPQRNYNLYHISSMEEITEDKVALIIKENYPFPVDLIDNTKGLRQRIVLSSDRFNNEFYFKPENSYREITPKIINNINKHKKNFLSNDDISYNVEEKNTMLDLFKKLVPYIESIVIFIPVFLLSNGIVANQYIESINFYLLFVLLFALMYGRQLVIFSSLLTVMGFILARSLESSDLFFLIDSDIYLNIVQIFIVGLSVGHLKEKYNNMDIEKKDEINYLNDRLNDISVINSSNVKIKDYYTDKLIGSAEGIGRIYEITSKLHEAEEGEVLFAALDTLKEIMDTKDVSIYLVSNQMFSRLASASSSKAASLGKSIILSDYEMIYDVLREKQVYINRSLDTNLPMMASALFDDSNKLRIVILLWELPYERMTLYNANVLSIVGALLYSVFVRDANYLDALAYRRYIPGTTVLQEEAFKEMVEIFRRAEEKKYTESSVLNIQNNDISVEEISGKVRFMLRETDYIGLTSDGNLAVLLTNTNKKEATHVRQRLSKENIITDFSISY